MKKSLLSIFAMAMLFVFTSVSYAQTTYTKVNSVAELEAGAQYILVGYDNDGNAYAMGYQKSNNRHALAIEESNGVVTTVVATDPSSQTDPFEFTLGGSAGAWTIFDALNNGYLNAPGGGNYLRTQTELTDNGKWTITEGEDGGFVPVSNGGVEQCYMRYNITSTLFGCYKESSNVVATVYFFKAGGAPVVEPEPSNYPTSFIALVAGVDVTLNWVDATGPQLPYKYLVLASKGNITVPVDGTPVANGALAMNVNYGAQTVTFTGLEGGTTYHFAIFPYTNSGSNIDYKNDGNYPTANATTENMYLLLDEDFAENLGSFTEYSVTGEQTWHQATYNSVTYANMNGYAGGAANENEDWLISPPMVIAANQIEELGIEFRTAMKFEGNPLEVYLSTDYDGAGAPDDYVWTDITNNFRYSTGNYEWVESGAYMISHPQAATYYLAFKYTSTSAAASSWEIDWVKVKGVQAVSVNEQVEQTFSVYPNPAHEMVSFDLESNAQVSVFDMTGRMVNTMNMAAGAGQLQIGNLENGVYFLNVRYADGKQEVTRFVKY